MILPKEIIKLCEKSNHIDDTPSKFSCLDTIKLKEILCNIANKENKIFKIYSIFKINISTYKIQKISDYFDKTEKQIPFYFDYVNNFIILSGINKHTLNKLSNDNKTYFFPIYYYSDFMSSAHVSLLYIKDKKAYLIDSNGMPNYYNAINKCSHCCIEFLLSFYFEQCDIQYIPIEKWYKGNEINGINFDGNCMTLTILLAHIISLSNKTLNDVYNELKQIPQDQLRTIIYNYQCNLVELFNI